MVPTLTFAATANAVVYTGAEPVFVDCDPATGNIDVPLFAQTLEQLRAEGVEVAAAVPVDIFGACADYTSLLPICAAAGVPVVADAAEALGATHAGRPAGSFGRIAAFSFNGNKILTTSAWMLVSDDRDSWRAAGTWTTQREETVHPSEHTAIGYNYRRALLAALGRAQLRRLDDDARAPPAGPGTVTKLSRPAPAYDCSTRRPAANNWMTVIRGSTRRRSAGRRRTSPPLAGTASRAVRCGSRCTFSRCPGRPARCVHGGRRSGS